MGDLLKLISAIIPNCKNTIKSVHTMKSFIASLVNSTDAVEKKYCSRCLAPVENNRCMRFTKCRTAKVNRFMYLHPEETLRKLFSDSDFLKLLSKGKRQSCRQNSEIFDVYDGLKYKELTTQSGFLRNKYNISFTLNTDGVNKYRSSKSGNIWPVYLIINELPKEYRFKIEYMIPEMVYCDRDKPNMLTFLKPLINKMNDWYMNGIDVKDTPDGDIHFHAMLFVTTADLQARADLMNMKHYNGQFSCHLCKDEGMGIGNGLHRVWPYNDNNELRSDEEQHQYIKQGTQKKACMGVKGTPVFYKLKCPFSLTTGFAIDWMHCVLLGVVKYFFILMISPATNGKIYNIGKFVDLIDRHLTKIKPPHTIGRFPRSIEDRDHWKATELKNWLIT